MARNLARSSSGRDASSASGEHAGVEVEPRQLAVDETVGDPVVPRLGAAGPPVGTAMGECYPGGPNGLPGDPGPRAAARRRGRRAGAPRHRQRRREVPPLLSARRCLRTASPCTGNSSNGSWRSCRPPRSGGWSGRTWSTMCADAWPRGVARRVAVLPEAEQRRPGVRPALSRAHDGAVRRRGPIIGPALDRLRGGRRLLVIVSCLGRAALCLIMAQVVTKPSPEGLLIYPFAFGALVLSKGYSVARSSLVPSLVDDQSSLVKANSRLGAHQRHRRGGRRRPRAARSSSSSARTGRFAWRWCSSHRRRVRARIPRIRRTQAPVDPELERTELHQPSILLAGSAMAILAARSASSSSSPRSRSRTTSSRSARSRPRPASGSSAGTSSRPACATTSGRR